MPLFPFLLSNVRFLSAGALLTLSSSYGQTYFISIFAAQIMVAFALSDGEWGAVYTVATTASAVVMFWAGALTDHFRVRALAHVVMPCLAVVCVLMAINTHVAGLVGIVFLLRVFGQGMMSQLAVVAMARWFVGRRGLALSVAAMGFAVGQALFPAAFAYLLDFADWRQLWILAAAMTLAAYPLLLWLLQKERTPQSLAETSDTVGMDGRHWTRNEVLRSPLFWLLMPMLLGPPAWGTSLFFQQVHIAETKGWSLVGYVSLFSVLTVVSVTTTLISGHLIDRFGTPRLAQVYLIPFILSFAVLSQADTLAGAAVALALFGLGAGVQATLPTAFWAEFYGTRHIGAIKAVSTSVMVFGSAIGPGISGALIDAGYNFPEQMVAICAYFVIATLFVLIGVQKATPRLTNPAQIDIKGA